MLWAALMAIPAAVAADSCRPAEITATDNAGCGRWFPRYHPKNSGP
jgi:hypothetical protein